MESVFSFEEMFNPVNQPVLGSDGEKIVFANSAAREILGNDICEHSLDSVFLPEILNADSSNFASSTRILGKSAKIFVNRKENVSVYYITLDDKSGGSIVLTSRILVYMRNCIAGIKLSADSCFLKPENDNIARQKHISILYHFYYRLARIIIQLDEADKLEHKEISFSPVSTDIVSLCADISGTLKSLGGYGKISFLSEESHIYAVVDPSLIELMLINLFSNSLKHAGNDCNISLSIKKAQNRIVISMDDDGVGIPQEKLANVFSPPAAGNDLIHTDEDMGLGLFISHSIVQLHGGAMLIESHEGGGVHIRIQLPTGEDESRTLNVPKPEYSGRSIAPILMGLADVLSSDCYGPKFED